MPPSNPYQTYRSVTTQRDWITRRKILFQELGDKNLVVPVGGNIQEAVDRLELLGGGIIRLADGTHSPTGNLTFPTKTPIQILGINMTTTVIDFGSADRRFILAGENIYTTGTVSITNGVTVTGSSTAWLSSGLVAGDEIFLDSSWYKITAITGDTTIILAEGYGGAVLSGATYRAGSIIRDIEITELTIKNSTSASGAIDIDDARNILLEDIDMTSNSKSLVATNVSELDWEKGRTSASTTVGITLTTGKYINFSRVSSVGNTTLGLSVTGVSHGSIFRCALSGNTTNGANITSCSNFNFIEVLMEGNVIGIEAVSGNTNCKFLNCTANGNSSDGIKLTATSDRCKIFGGDFTNNGGYGVNIAASTCNDNVLALSTFSLNTTDRYNDSGTNSNIQV